jgi:multiple sugar transport system substrate-binding protein
MAGADTGAMAAQRGRAAGGISRRRLAVAGAALGGAALAAACGAGGEAGGGAARARRAVTLQYWSRFAAPIQDVEEKHLPIFQERFAPIRVERTLASTDYAKLVEKVTTAFASSTPPDVFTMGSPDIVTYAHPGSVLKLDAYAHVRKHAEDFFGPPLAIGRYKDKLYGLTYYIDTRIMMYRKDMLAEVGLPSDRKSLPKTWDQFREVAKKLVRWEGSELKRLGWDIATMGDATQFLVMLGQQGKKVIAADGKKVEFDGPEGQRALQTLVDFVHRDRMDSLQRPQFPSGVDSLGTPFVAIKWGNAGPISSMRRAGMDPDQLVAPDLTPEFSGKPTAASYLGGTWQMVAKATQDVDAALDLAAYLTGPEVGLAVAESQFAPPPHKSSEKSPYVQQALVRPFYDSLQYGWVVPQHPKYAEIRTKLIEVTRDAMQQKRPVKEALADAAAYASALLAAS